MKTIKKIVPVIIAIAMVFTLAGCNNQHSATPAKDSKSKDNKSSSEAFPDFTAKDFAGNDLDQTMFADNDVTLLNFWFNGCSACVNEMPGLEKFNEKLREKGAAIVGVNVQVAQDKDSLKEAQDILKKQGVTYTNMYITGGKEANDYIGKIFSYPTTIVVDKNGKIIGSQIVGAIDSEKRMAQLLKLVDDIKAGNKVDSSVSSDNPQEDQAAKLIAEENNLFMEHANEWNKVFANVQKNNIQDAGNNYAEFLKSQVEAIKDTLTEDELNILNADLKKIEELETKVQELKSSN